MKYQIGDIIKDEKRNLTIIAKDRIKGILSYKYRCNICGYDCSNAYKDGKYQDEYWIIGSHLTSNKVGCACCQGRAVVNGINNVGFTSPEIAQYIKNDIDKLKYTKCSKKKIEFVCPICKTECVSTLSNVYCQGFVCKICSGTMSLGERMVYQLLNLINVDFIKEYSSGNSDCTGRYRYDFYISPNIIIEIMGIQHYRQTFGNSRRSLEEEQENDKSKELLAKNNGITEYIIIDASKTNFDFIKNNILHSRLSKIFDLSNVDWHYIEKKVCTSLVKEVCDYWNSDTTITTGLLSEKFHLSYLAIQNYLKQGDTLGWCKYDPKNYRKANIYKNDTVNTSNPIKCVENNKYFKSVGLCARKCVDAFGIQLNESSIRSVLQGKYSHHRHYHFEYITKQDFNKAFKMGYECYGSLYRF